jgi:demethylmenaquinone methyltransferase / 2-methoxy-6-polyprenyl-1,4-benzoquinol methylase
VAAQSAINKQKENVAAMFNDIAVSYDFLNHFLSANTDKLWRKKAVKMLMPYSPKIILDIATGTGDLAIALQKLNPEKTIGIDIAEEMLEIGRKKINSLGLQNNIELRHGDALNIPFPESSFDAVTVAFGVRNFENLDKGLSQIYNTLKKEGVFLILEFSRPKRNLLGVLFKFYFAKILPLLGQLFSKNKKAYRYLFDSVQLFPSIQEMKENLGMHGFKDISAKSLSFGIATIYIASK